jgi:hypothetical protein
MGLLSLSLYLIHIFPFGWITPSVCGGMVFLFSFFPIVVTKKTHIRGEPVQDYDPKKTRRL